jgi:hypothetical protein
MSAPGYGRGSVSPRPSFVVGAETASNTSHSEVADVRVGQKAKCRADRRTSALASELASLVLGVQALESECVVFSFPSSLMLARCLEQLDAPCFSLISNWGDVREMPMLQHFLKFSADGSLFFSKFTLILAK